MFKIRECKKLMKKCNCCGQVKLVTCFRKQNGGKDGFRNKCKECSSKTHTYICEYCHKKFKGDSKKPKYCSQKCMGLAYRKEESHITYKCEMCGKEKTVKIQIYNSAEHHFCSCKCRSKYRSLYESGINSDRYDRVKIECEICGKTSYITKTQYNNTTHHYCSKKCSSIGWTKFYSGKDNPLYERKRPDMLGDKNSSWNPNLTQRDREYGRISEELKKWRLDVLERDNYTCQITGKRGGELNCHHLNSYHWDKENRTNVDNGITLSKEIHELFHHIYGYKNNTKEQFEEFKQRYINKEFEEVV